MFPRCSSIRPHILLTMAIALSLAGCGSNLDTSVKGTAMTEARAAGASLTEGVQSRTLDNGLTVLVKENHSAPVVAAVTWVRTGYFHEPDELAGISHVVEHMYFNGTPDRPDPEAISRETKGYGGILNAGTIYDHTSYYVVLPSEQWKKGLAVQADAYQNPLFDADTLDREMEAILQEARRKLDSPTAFGREKMFELAFQKHRMRRWRIGTEEVLRSIDREDVARWYEHHYRPENTVLSIVGDVDAEEVFAEVERLYGDHPRGELRRHTGPSESAQEDFRYRRLRGDLQRNYSFLGYHTPGEGHEDNAALDILAAVLGEGRSSRLNRRLRDELGIVTSVSASSYRFDDVGLFEIDAISDREELDYATREIFVEVERIKLLGPTEGEIQRARSILETSQMQAQEEVFGQASVLAAYQADGDYRLYDRELEALREVTAEDVQRVARKYLTMENASLLEYTPIWMVEGRDREEMEEHLRGAVMVAVREMEPRQQLEPAPSLLDRERLAEWSEKVVGAQAPGTTRTFDLPHGGTLIVEEDDSVPTAHAGIYFRGGRVQEFPNVSGLTELMQRVMVTQTNNRDPEHLAFEVESLGTSISRVLRDDWFGFDLDGLAGNLPQSLDLLFDVVTNPLFTEDVVEIEKQAQISAIRGIQDRSTALAMFLARKALFDLHPYGLPAHGYEQAVKYFDALRLDDHHAERVRPESMVVCVVGDVKAERVFELVSLYAEDFTMGGTPRPATAEAFYSNEELETVPALLFDREIEESKDRSQTALIVAYQTPEAGHPDTYPLEVLQAVTGGLGGTFFEEIRGRRGLAYQVSTFDVAKALGGFFGTFVACSPDSAETVQELVLDLHAQLAESPPDEESVERARNYLAGSYQIGRQTHRARATLLARHALLGRPLSEIEEYPELIRAVTREDLQRVARQYFQGRTHGVGIVHGTSGSDASPQ